MRVVETLAGLLQFLSEVGALLADALELLLVSGVVERAGKQKLGELVLSRFQRGQLTPEALRVVPALSSRFDVRAVEDLKQLFRDGGVDRDGLGGAREAGEDVGRLHVDGLGVLPFAVRAAVVLVDDAARFLLGVVRDAAAALRALQEASQGGVSLDDTQGRGLALERRLERLPLGRREHRLVCSRVAVAIPLELAHVERVFQQQLDFGGGRRLLERAALVIRNEAFLQDRSSDGLVGRAA